MSSGAFGDGSAVPWIRLVLRALILTVSPQTKRGASGSGSRAYIRCAKGRGDQKASPGTRRAKRILLLARAPMQLSTLATDLFPEARFLSAQALPRLMGNCQPTFCRRPLIRSRAIFRGMKDKTEKAKARGAGAQTRGSSGSTTTGNSKEARMLAQNSRIGNEAFQSRLDASNLTRDEMMKYVGDRLTVISDVQRREVSQMSTRNERDWWKEVADAQKGLAKPDPTRWHEATKLYEQAAEQFAAGKVGRGKEILESAIRAEESAFTKLTKLVNVKDIEREALESAPDSYWEIKPHQACTPSDIPPELKQLAESILDEGKEIKDPPVRKTVKAPWWTEEEEEEEDGDGDGAG